jgi:transcriptional regulator with XRE-family HTH domain
MGHTVHEPRNNNATRKALRDRWRRAVVAVLSASRRDAELTQVQLAEKLGWSQSRLAKMEAGDRKIDIADFILIARALDTEPDVLFRRILKW